MNNFVTINSIQQRMAEGVPLGHLDETSIRRLWWAALDTLQDEILLPLKLSQGLWLSSPLPALYEPTLLNRLKGWVWTPDKLIDFQNKNVGLLPPTSSFALTTNHNSAQVSYSRLNLRNGDGYDPLLIIITPEIQVALALNGNKDERKLIIRSDPETLHDLLNLLDARLDQEDPEEAEKLRKVLKDLGPLRTNEKLAESFWPMLSEKLASMAPSLNIQTLPDAQISNEQDKTSDGDISLLEALTHEIRTPLATIRTLIRSLLKKEDISNLVVTRLRQIDAECTEQIDRFGLIFNAIELERKQSKSSNLASTDLGNMLESFRPSWNQQLERRGLKFHLDIEPDLPQVLSDPKGLELMLRGLVDKNIRGLPPGSKLILDLRPAGQRLKLKIFSKIPNTQSSHKDNSGNSLNSDLGPVLSWDPVTGSLQLSKAATQRLLASLGGRIANRRDSGLTIFFPIADR